MSKLELLQGTLDMLVLQVLNGGPMHGWGIAQRIQLLSKDVLQVEEGSIYPVQGLLEGVLYATRVDRVERNRLFGQAPNVGKQRGSVQRGRSTIRPETCPRRSSSRTSLTCPSGRAVV